MEYLSDKNRKALLRIQESFPNAIIGGSMALAAWGLLNRTPKDIDVMLPLREHGSQKFTKFHDASDSPGRYREDITDVNGSSVIRQAMIIEDANVCFFFVNEGWQTTFMPIKLEGINIKAQTLSAVFMAKMAYARISTHTKHHADLIYAIGKLESDYITKSLGFV